MKNKHDRTNQIHFHINLDINYIVLFHPRGSATLGLFIKPLYSNYPSTPPTTIHTFPHKNQAYNTSKHSHYNIRFQNTWIYDLPRRKAQQTKWACNQCYLNRIDLNSNNPPWFPAAAEYAHVGLHLFEGVRACSALFTVKRMKMNSQIVDPFISLFIHANTGGCFAPTAALLDVTQSTQRCPPTPPIHTHTSS